MATTVTRCTRCKWKGDVFECYVDFDKKDIKERIRCPKCNGPVKRVVSKRTQGGTDGGG